MTGLVIKSPWIELFWGGQKTWEIRGSRAQMTLLAAALILLLWLPSAASAWGGDGHQIVALIAEGHLSPEAKAGIRDLLGEANISDAEIANWADEVRRERRSTAPWHYVNIPASADVFDRKRDGNGGNNVIDKIEAFEKTLA